MSIVVRDNPEQSRFEIHVDGALAGFSEYKLSGDDIAFVHTVIDDAFEGRGLAKILVSQALDTTRDTGLSVLPFCPYVRRFIEKNPDYLDLVPEDQRARFQLA
jgi:predicted GNAT family acetyltransferase